MSQHEYFCHTCNRSFSKTLSPAEYGEGSIVCPHCGSEDVEQRTSAFYPVSSRESARFGQSALLLRPRLGTGGRDAD